MRYRLFNDTFLKPMTFNAEGGDSGGEGNTTQDTNTSTNTTTGETDIAKLVEAAVADAVAGLRKKNDELIGKEKKLKAELDTLKSKPSLNDDEYKNYLSLKERIERDALLKDIAEGKTEEVLDRVTKKTRLELEAKIAAEAEARQKVQQDAETWRTRYEQTLVNNEITKAASGAVKPQYLGLVEKLVADRVKLIDGEVRVVNEDGEIEMTATGSKPLTVADYIETLRTSYSDLFHVSTGGGASGSTKAGGGTRTSTKVSMEAAGELSLEEYSKARAAGRI